MCYSDNCVSACNLFNCLQRSHNRRVYNNHVVPLLASVTFQMQCSLFCFVINKTRIRFTFLCKEFKVCILFSRYGFQLKTVLKHRLGSQVQCLHDNVFPNET